ncbi:MAG: 16S rRNA (guanine(966)-N(2))-methyltransferase RsmD [bacterium]
MDDSARASASGASRRPVLRMRVIGGFYRRRELAKLPRGLLGVRPTYDRVRENLFNVLGERVRGARFLDLYAGTGAVGIEALSRGAGFATFVDDSLGCGNLIRRNCESLGVAAGSYEIVVEDAREFIRSSGAGAYDVVFMDPPYGEGILRETLEALGASRLAGAGATVACQGGKMETERGIGGFELTRQERWGSTWITFWRMEGVDEK